ncbi:MAG TPA: dicarboxylate/amino acid:cation symporter [Gemmatimonadaceae bacterium]|nr:dicarboxylate/amino acid:cation symporter [Gemmatimonadaceae bacterium]
MSLTTRVLIALVLGLAAGIAAAASGSPALLAAARAVEPVGQLFINAIRMTVIPLVVASLIVGTAGTADLRAIGRVGGRAIALFTITLLAASTLSALVSPPIFARMPLGPEATAALQASAAGGAAAAAETARKVPTFGAWLVELVPANPVKAAADGAMLPLIVFAVAFGLAVARVGGERRQLVVAFFDAVAEASITLVRWVLAFAPLGVFALALPLATRLGAAAAGALAYFIVTVCVLCTAYSVLVLVPAAALFGRVPPRAFLRASAPAIAVALSARSSLAALPAMIEGARDRLRLPEPITGFFLPLAASVFRTGSAVYYPAAAAFVARLYGVEIDPAHLATIVLVAVLATYSVPSVPGGTLIVMIPVLESAGLPLESIALLFGADAVPDMVRTGANVTGHMTVGTILGRGAIREHAARVRD